MMKPKNDSSLGKEPVFMKLGKSIVFNKNLKKGETLNLNNLSGKIFNTQYIPVRESNKVIKKKLNRNINKGEPIYFEDLI